MPDIEKNKCRIVMDYIHSYYVWWKENYWWTKCEKCGKKLD